MSRKSESERGSVPFHFVAVPDALFEMACDLKIEPLEFRFLEILFRAIRWDDFRWPFVGLKKTIAPALGISDRYARALASSLEAKGLLTKTYGQRKSISWDLSPLFEKLGIEVPKVTERSPKESSVKRSNRNHSSGKDGILTGTTVPVIPEPQFRSIPEPQFNRSRGVPHDSEVLNQKGTAIPTARQREVNSFSVLGRKTVALIERVLCDHEDLSKQSLVGWIERLAERDSENYEAIFRMGIEEADVKWAEDAIRNYPGYLHSCLFANGTGHQHPDMIDNPDKARDGTQLYTGTPLKDRADGP